MATEIFMFPASFAQQRLWFLDQMVPGTAFYNISQATKFPFQVNSRILEMSLNEIVQRHETLRTTFKAVDGKPFQVVTSFMKLDLLVHDLTHLTIQDRDVAAQQLADRDAAMPFDLAKGPLIRASLIKLDYDDHVFMFSMHHIISDIWSVNIFFNELSVLYESFVQGKPSPLPELPLQYADFSVWQLEYLKGSVLKEEVAYWKEKLDDITPLQLPLDKPRLPFQSFRGGHEVFELPESLSNAIKKLSQQENATLFMTLLSAFVALLHRYSQQYDIVVGVPLAGRNQTEIENLIGFFVNSIVIRTQLPTDISFTELLQKVKAISLEAFAHGDLPFEKLVEELHPIRDVSRNPLFQVLFQMATAKDTTSHTSHKKSMGIDVILNTSKFDLTLSMREENGKLLGYFEYNTDLFFPQTIERLTCHYINLLQAIVDSPLRVISGFEFLDIKEKQQLLFDWNNNSNPYPIDELVHQLIEKRAIEWPEQIAIFTDIDKISYAELNSQANQLAHFLIREGITPDAMVVVCIERSVKMVVTHLAILKAGGAFVPLDPAYPAERLAFTMNDSGASFLIIDEHLKVQLLTGTDIRIVTDRDWKAIEDFPVYTPKVSLLPANRAYVIYTSGSTGKPKGVELSHGGLLNLVHWQIETYEISRRDCCLQMATPAYDAYVYELFPCLASGATVYLMDDFTRTSPSQLKDKLIEKGVTISILPTSLAESILNEPWPDVVPLRILGTAGEKLMRLPLNPLPFKFLNLYGPTENTVIASYWPVATELTQEFPPIGRPVTNVQLYILDNRLNPVPVGISGELFIGGEAIARGYLNRPGLTAEKFVPDPFAGKPGRRLYKTGDLVRYLPDGNIDFIGRIDNQVKLRGYRVELEEIEKVIREHAAIREAVVMLKDIYSGDKAILAYVSLHPGDNPSAEMIRTFLKDKLPAFMIPSFIIILDDLPKSISGKVDRKALPNPNELAFVNGNDYDPAVTPMEMTISNVWKKFMRVEKISVNKNFFDAGGHSLMMAQVHHYLREKLDTQISLIDLFQFPTIRSLAGYLEGNSGRRLYTNQQPAEIDHDV